jgi:tetratricopeptide (TPR) repeat protein
METVDSTPATREPWNKGKLVIQKTPFKLKEIWAIRVRLQIARRCRDLALFNLAIDSKLRACAQNEALVALERNPSSAVALWTALRDKHDDPAQSGVHDTMLRWDAPYLALSKARSGDLPGARALVDLTPHDCYRCNLARGEIAALAEDHAGSEQWFADAIKRAPTLPQAYVDRGHSRLDRGDLAGALADAAEAAKLSSHDGDAWKLWGDVLTQQGTRKEALVKYEEALKYAPNWAALKEAHAAAATHTT